MVTDSARTLRRGLFPLGLRDLPPAAAAGLAAGVLAAALWVGAVMVFGRHLSLLSILVGPAVGGGLLWAARWRRGRLLQAGAVLITLALLLSAEYLAVRSLGIDYLQERGITGIPLLLDPRAAWNLVAAGMVSDPITPAYFGVSLWIALLTPSPSR
jgi:hypothetical protein